jgi:phage-related tail protein
MAAPPAPDQTATEPPPKTVQEMVEKSAKSAGNSINETQKTAGAAAKSASTALEKAGSAVGGAAKSSWECLSSFFSKC